MDYYIVRIYRREKGDPEDLVGTVEAASSADRKAFASSDELWDILGGFGDASRGEKKGKGRRRGEEAR